MPHPKRNVEKETQFGGKPRRAVLRAAWAQSPARKTKQGLGVWGVCVEPAGGSWSPLGPPPICTHMRAGEEPEAPWESCTRLVLPSLKQEEQLKVLTLIICPMTVTHLLTLIVYKLLINQTSLEEKTAKECSCWWRRSQTAVGDIDIENGFPTRPTTPTNAGPHFSVGATLEKNKPALNLSRTPSARRNPHTTGPRPSTTNPPSSVHKSWRDSVENVMYFKRVVVRC